MWVANFIEVSAKAQAAFDKLIIPVSGGYTTVLFENQSTGECFTTDYLFHTERGEGFSLEIGVFLSEGQVYGSFHVGTSVSEIAESYTEIFTSVNIGPASVIISEAWSGWDLGGNIGKSDGVNVLNVWYDMVPDSTSEVYSDYGQQQQSRIDDVVDGLVNFGQKIDDFVHGLFD